MKLVILGANGRTGKLVLQAALDKGMDVTAVVRSAGKKPTILHERLKVVVGDPCDRDFLKHTLRGQDASTTGQLTLLWMPHGTMGSNAFL